MLKAYIDVTLKKSILDPQGTAVKEGLSKLGFEVETVRIGKHIEVTLNDMNRENAEKLIDEMCLKLLINPEIEVYSYRIEEE
ncbi:phosphoribosylformylglycinamidine synthase subunit PurS [Fonticella tunisiensis]|uniref:Phosphoribosylformylglycinamidine synthase subunit PurS n=1 Tax=Fonticella tunisiensis TaxID=1096341 RepID=A0A4R7KRZ0_9CLOT|nr:phosphoribosylformylglycinamidine synthase subunit PurS [Fonticella tunisiensis]TDT62326.1 phosphoribosylformylglycinamidine synthase [Fonticella tunisiensis]